MSAATDPTAPAVATRALRRRRIKAVLAAGIVLGIGAAATLAAYTDDEYASGTFTAGKFGIEGSLSSAAAIPEASWSSHPTAASPAALSFTTGGVFNNLLPGNTVYAPFSIRIDSTTTTNGSLTLPGVTTTGTPANFTYGIRTVADPTLCTQTGYTAAVANAVVADGTALGTAAPAGSYSATLLKAAGTAVPITYCFAVTAGTNVAQGQTATATWHFLGTAVPIV